MTPEQTDAKFLCDQCDYQGLTKKQLSSHTTTHKEKKFHCTHCDYKAVFKSILNKHNLIHEGLKPFVCDHSGCTFSSVFRGSLNSHSLTHSQEKPYECSLCKEAFRYYKQLQNHVRVHKGKKHLGCPIESCNFSTQRPSSLKLHMCIHTGEKPVWCEFEGCKYSCIRQHQLKIHSYKHTREKRFVCSFKGCNYGSITQYILNLHFRTHTGEKPYECKVEGCGYSCTNSSSLRKHQLKHLMDNPGNDQKGSQSVSTSQKRSKSNTDIPFSESSEKEMQTIPTEKCQSASNKNNSCTEIHTTVTTKSNCENNNTAALKNPPKKYSCKICDFGTKKKQKYKDHQQSHISICSLCDFSCSKKKVLKIHMRTHFLPDENDYFPGRPNPEVPSSKKDFSLVVSMSSLAESSQNSQCAITVANVAEKDTGLPVNGIKRSLYQCKLCDFGSKKKNKYKVHLEWHRVKGCLFCLRCDFVSFKKKQLHKHFRTHDEVPVQRRF